MAKKKTQVPASGDNSALTSILGSLVSAVRPIENWTDTELLRAIQGGDQRREALRVLRSRHSDGMRIVVDDSTSSMKIFADDTIDMIEWVQENGGRPLQQWKGRSVVTLADFSGAMVSVHPMTGQALPPGNVWESVSEDLQVLIVLARLKPQMFPNIITADEFTLLAELKASKTLAALKTHPRWGDVARYASLKTNKAEVDLAKSSLLQKRGGAASSAPFFNIR